MNIKLLDSIYKSFSSNENLKNEILSFNLGELYDLFHENSESNADLEGCDKQ